MYFWKSVSNYSFINLPIKIQKPTYEHVVSYLRQWCHSVHYNASPLFAPLMNTSRYSSSCWKYLFIFLFCLKNRKQLKVKQLKLQDNSRHSRLLYYYYYYYYYYCYYYYYYCKRGLKLFIISKKATPQQFHGSGWKCPLQFCGAPSYA